MLSPSVTSYLSLVLPVVCVSNYFSSRVDLKESELTFAGYWLSVDSRISQNITDGTEEPGARVVVKGTDDLHLAIDAREKVFTPAPFDFIDGIELVRSCDVVGLNPLVAVVVPLST
ncbi:hypothetical protein LCGC14_2718890, partial [marine sediment metagenome]